MSNQTRFNGKRTIQTALCDMFAENPGATDAEVTAMVLEGWPNSTYCEARVQTDRNKFNHARFLCQGGVVPSVLAFNPEAKTKRNIREASLESVEGLAVDIATRKPFIAQN